MNAICLLKGKEVSGTITFSENNNKVSIKGDINGLTAGKHGFHIHENGDLSNGCISAGGHFNSSPKKLHGAPTDTERHIGDLGNITAGANGKAEVSFDDSVITVSPGKNSILGRALVVHAGEDDLGRGGDAESKRTGNAGLRVACGVIGMKAAC